MSLVVCNSTCRVFLYRGTLCAVACSLAVGIIIGVETLNRIRHCALGCVLLWTPGTALGALVLYLNVDRALLRAGMLIC